MVARVAAFSLCLALLSLNATAKEAPPPIRVSSVTFKETGRIKDTLLQECDVARIVTAAVEKSGAKTFRKSGRKDSQPPEPIELALRIDRLIRTGGQMQPASPGGIELGVSVIRIGSTDASQPFQCQTLKLLKNLEHSNCGRIEWCSNKIAEQIGTWVSWQSR